MENEAIARLRTRLREHHARIQRAKYENGVINPSRDAYAIGHDDGLLSGLAFAIRYLDEMFPPIDPPFDILTAFDEEAESR